MFLRLAILLLPLTSGFAAEVFQVTWPTQAASPPPRLSPEAEQLLPVFRLGLDHLPEATVVDMCLAQPLILGLTREQAATLRPLAAERYALIAKNPAYARAPSALSYCFAPANPGHGLASVHVPDHAGPGTPVIVFIHGYGGSFLWYQHYFAEVFPDHILICPAYGITTATIAQEYVTEAVAAVERKLQRKSGPPMLIGLSAGGFGACRLYARHPELFSRHLSLAAFPPDDVLNLFARHAQPAFLAGGDEAFVLSGDFARRMRIVRATCPSAQAGTIPGAGHFFMLTHREQTVTALRTWMGR